MTFARTGGGSAAIVLVSLTARAHAHAGADAAAPAADAAVDAGAPPDAAAAVPAVPSTAKKKLVVGTYPIAPFIVKRDGGEWTGISIEIWKRVAREVGIDYEIREYERTTWRDRADKEVDVGVNMNITEAGEKKFDLSHAFYRPAWPLRCAKKRGGGAVLWRR